MLANLDDLIPVGNAVKVRLAMPVKVRLAMPVKVRVKVRLAMPVKRSMRAKKNPVTIRRLRRVNDRPISPIRLAA